MEANDYYEGMKYLAPILGLLMLALNAYPWIATLATVPADRRLIGFHNSAGDYPTYVSSIKQGLDGHIFTKNMYAVEPHGRGVYFIFYAFIGFVSGLLGATDAHVVYHVSRYVLGALWFFVLYLLLGRITRSKTEQRVAFFIALTSASLPRWAEAGGQFVLSRYLPWWTEFDPILRAAFLPHYLAGHTLLALCLYFAVRAKKESRPLFDAGAAACGWFAGLIHPPSLIILLLVAVFWRYRPVLLRLAFIGITVTSLLLVNWQAKQFPWSTSRDYESLSFALSVPETLLALGPVVLLAAVGFAFTLKHTFARLCVLWIALTLFMMWASKMILNIPWPVFRMFPISNVRFLQTALWVPLAVLAAYAFTEVKKRFGSGPVILLSAVFLGLTLIGYPRSITAQKAELGLIEDYHAPKREWVGVITKLDEITTPGPVLSMQWSGALIPTFSSRTAFTGNQIITPDHDKKMGTAYKLYEGLPDCTAYTSLVANGVYLVFVGFDELRAGNAASSYPFLKKVIQAGDSTLYERIAWTGNCSN